jgi:hypothetical protein
MTLLSSLGLRTAQPFVVGDLSAPIGSRKVATIGSDDTVRIAIESYTAITDTLLLLNVGDLVSRWGWLMEWGEGCVKPPELEAVSSRKCNISYCLCLTMRSCY